MKNQYFGDINDYYKYGILRILGGLRDNEYRFKRLDSQNTRSKLSIALCWMLTPNDNTSHGNDCIYLERPDLWRNNDPALYDFIKKNYFQDINVLKEANIIPYDLFYDEELSDDKKLREIYFNNLYRENNYVLIFFDPDIGMQVESCPNSIKRSSKHLYWDELKECFNNKYSILLYQHFRQGVSVEKLIKDITTKLKDKIGINYFIAFETKGAVLFLIPQKCHYNLFKTKAGQISGIWKDKIKLHNPSNMERISAPTDLTKDLRIKLIKSCACGCPKPVITSRAFFISGHDGRVSGWFRSIFKGSKKVADLNLQAQALWKAWNELGSPGGYEHPKLIDAAKKVWNDRVNG